MWPFDQMKICILIVVITSRVNSVINHKVKVVCSRMLKNENNELMSKMSSKV